MSAGKPAPIRRARGSAPRLCLLRKYRGREPNMKILGISGSLRKGSYNTALLKATKSFLLSDIQFEIISIGNIPLYSEDVEAANMPKEVKK
jgi:NADPH-dependent FMN reductase